MRISIEKDTKQRNFRNPFHRLTLNIMFTNGWLPNKYAKILKPYNLTEQQFKALRILREANPQACKVNYIIDSWLIKCPTFSH